jgi:two-component system, LytTR family, sensor kinase
MKKAGNKIWIQVLYWAGLYAFWVMVFQKRAFALSTTATIEFCYLIFIAINYYFNFYFGIPKYLYRKKYAAFLFSMLAAIVLTALLRVPLAAYLSAHYFLKGAPQPGFRDLFANSFLNILIWTVCLVAAKLVMDYTRIQNHLDIMAKEKEKAELDFLNAQFNPHFLFNSINVIYGHIDKHNTEARNMLLKFSEMLRYQLYDCSTSAIPIEKELNYVRNYVALQKARKEETLIVDLCIAKTLDGFTIAPLLFIAFIENAFKYAGNNEDQENGVYISFQQKDSVLMFSCRNSKDKNATITIEHQGIGIANARRRLALLYPKKHDLLINDGSESYEVILKLNLA